MTDHLPTLAHQLAEAINSMCLDVDQIGYLSVLDALATVGVTLTADEAKEASRAYASAVDMEGLWARS